MFSTPPVFLSTPPFSFPLFPLPIHFFPPSLFSVPFIFTWLFPSACCITLSQPNGITSEHVSLSLLSATPPLIARKLLKRRTRTTPSSFCFLPIVSFIPFALTPFSKYLLPGVPVDFFPWLDYYFSPFLIFGSASWHKSFIIYLLGISFSFCSFQHQLTSSVCT